MAERLFFALWPDSVVREEIRRRLEPLGLRGRLVAPANWHITLAFLGIVEAAQRHRFELAAAQFRGAPFELVLDRLGFFRRTRVVWLGAAQAPEALIRLHGALNSGLREAGFKPERRPFRAHLTLARNASPPGRLPAPAPVSWRVDRFCLVHSELTRGGPRYHKAHEFLLTR